MYTEISDRKRSRFRRVSKARILDGHAFKVSVYAVTFMAVTYLFITAAISYLFAYFHGVDYFLILWTLLPGILLGCALLGMERLLGRLKEYMFPGMGAYSFLARRIDPIQVERMILSGRIYSAQELHEMCLIDVVTESGNGNIEVENFIRKLEKSKGTRSAIRKMRNLLNPVSFEEMLDIGEIWVESAFSLSERELKTMQRLVRSQDRVAKSLVASDSAGNRKEIAS